MGSLLGPFYSASREQNFDARDFGVGRKSFARSSNSWMVRRTVSKLKTEPRSSVQIGLVVFRLILVAGWPSIFLLTDDTDVHHYYLLISGNVVSFLHSGLNDFLFAHVAAASTFLASLLARPPYRVWGIGSVAYVTVVLASAVLSRRLDSWTSWRELFRVQQKPA